MFLFHSEDRVGFIIYTVLGWSKVLCWAQDLLCICGVCVCLCVTFWALSGHLSTPCSVHQRQISLIVKRHFLGLSLILEPRAVYRMWARPVFPLQGLCWGTRRGFLLCDPGHSLEGHDWWLCPPAQYDPSEKRIFCLVSWRLGCMGPFKLKQKLRPLWEVLWLLGGASLQVRILPPIF